MKLFPKTGPEPDRPHGRRRRATALAAVTALGSAGLVLTQMTSAQAAISPSGWYTVVAANSGKCVDAAAAGTANGTAVQQYACNSSAAQQWQFRTATDAGYVTVVNQNGSQPAWDVAGPSTADAAKVHLWGQGGWASQEWQPVQEASGRYHFVDKYSNKCLDVPSASTADAVQLQQYTCNGTTAQSFTLTLVGGTSTPTPTPSTSSSNPPVTNPDLGPNVTVFDPSMSSSSIQSKLTSVFNSQQSNQFGSQRYALLFKPGSYTVDANVGFYEQVAGLGLSPDDVTINGGVHAEADWFQGNATQNFWRSAENLSVKPTSGTDRWAVSQAAPYRRIHLKGNLVLDDGGWSSGGLIADSKIDGNVNSGSQQQWLTRNSQIGSWSGSNWNMVFAGVTGAPAQSFPNPKYTTVAQTPVTREKPFLYVDAAGAYQVFVPAVRTNSTGPSWTSGTTAGSSIPISQFYVVKAGDTAATIDTALAAGKNLLVTPGVYHLSDTIRVTRPDTVVLGLGLATFIPDNGVTAMTVADVDGVKIAGLLFDAGTTNSPYLLQVGPAGSSATHAGDPTSLHDVFFRVGGAAVGKASVSLEINSSNVIGDHTWIWRADHGSGVGWTSNTAARGLNVNGNNVTMYGLFVEHYQNYQVYWKGNGGRTYFFQNETPYDAPDNNLWASYKVDDSVTNHEAWGLGAYAYYTANPNNTLDHAFEVPNTSGVKLHDLITTVLGGSGHMTHIVNSTGAAVSPGSNVATLVSYP